MTARWLLLIPLTIHLLTYNTINPIKLTGIASARDKSKGPTHEIISTYSIINCKLWTRSWHSSPLRRFV